MNDGITELIFPSRTYLDMFFILLFFTLDIGVVWFRGAAEMGPIP